MAAKISYINVFVYAALLFSLIAVLIVISGALFFSDKGFELSDETFYLIYSNNFNSETYTTSNFGLLNNFFCFGYPTLINLRIAKLVYQSLAVIILAFSLFKYLKHAGFEINKLQKIFIIIITLMASYINYDYLPMTMSYNTWSLVLILLFFSIILFELSNRKAGTNLMSALGFGFICFCLFLVKFPNVVFAVLVYWLCNLFFIRENLGYKFLAMLAGILLGYFVFLNNFGDLKNIFHNYYVTLFEVKHVEANSYSAQFMEYILMCIQKKYLLIELIIVLATVLIKKLGMERKYLFGYCILILNLLFTFLFMDGNSKQLHNDFMAGTLFIINGFLFVYMFREQKSAGIKSLHVFISTALLLMPFCLMLGTNNAFYYTTSQISVIAIFGLLAYMAFARQLSVHYLAIKALVLCTFVLNALQNGAVKTPYRQENLCEKKYPLNFNPAIAGIYESYERYCDYTTLNKLISIHNVPETKILTFFNHFGIEYITDGGVYPDSPLTDGAHLMAYNEYVFKRYKLSDRFSVLVLPEAVNNNQSFYKLFKIYGIMPGENYKLVYSYKFKSDGNEVFIYKHI